MVQAIVRAGCDAVSRSFAGILLHLCKPGWSQVEVPNGWVQLIRGPRPKSVQWPRAKEGKPKQVVPQRQLRTPTASSRSPEEVAEQARKRVGQLQVAMHALDPTDPARPALEEALKKARGLATFPSLEGASPVHRAILDPCEEEVGGGGGEGSGGGVHRKARFSPNRNGFCGGEVRQVEGRGGSWGQEGHPVPNPQFHILPEVTAELDRLPSMVANSMQVDHDSEIRRLREQVAQLQGISTPVERPRVRQRVDPVPYMPGLVPAELCTVDGGPPGRSPRGPQFGRHQSHFGIDVQVEWGGRTVGGDERWHVAMTSRYGLRGVHGSERLQILGLSKLEAPADWQIYHMTQHRSG